MKRDTSPLHGRYIIGILAACLVVQVSSDWSRVKDLSATVSFAVGLTSLILAVIAIIQNLVSGPNLASSLASVTTAATTIAGLTGKLEIASDALLAGTELIGAIPSQLRDTEERISAGFSAGFAKIEQQARDDTGKSVVASSATLVTQPTAEGIASASIKLTDFTFGATVGLYLAIRLVAYGKPVKIAEVLAKSTIPQYLTAYISSAFSILESIGYISASNGDGWSVSEVKAFSFEEILKRMENLNDQSFIRENRKVIDDYFSDLMKPPIPPTAP